LAIQNVWIIDSSSGICIYDWYLNPEESIIDEQLVSGLLIAFKNFSSEAGLVDISAIEGLDKKLAYQAIDKYIIAAICHGNDYEPLVDETLHKILSRFRKRFAELLDNDMTTDVSPFREFDDELYSMIEGRNANRGPITIFVGSLSSLFIIGVVAIIAVATLPNLAAILPFTYQIVFFLELLISIFIGGLVGGLVAGERRIAIIASAASIVPVIIALLILLIPGWGTVTNKLFYSLLYIVIFEAICILGGLLGGYLRERRYFFPVLTIEEQQTETENIIPL
jgi:hypothetical protein